MARLSGLMQLLVASAESHVAISSGSATDQLMIGLEASCSLNCVSYCSQAYGWN